VAESAWIYPLTSIAISDERSIEMTQSYLGPVVCALLQDPTVMDILYHPTWVAVDRVGVGLVDVPEAIGTAKILNLLRHFGTILTQAVPEHTEVVELTLPGFRARFSGLYVGRNGCDSFFTIRRPTVHGLELEAYVESGTFSQETLAYLLSILRNPFHGILIAGATGSGKTTLLASFIRAILRYRTKREHLLIVEDTPELWIEQPLVTAILATPRLNYRAALRAALRHRPDRLIVGEVRGGEALDAVKAGATGHGLLMTIHSESAMSAVHTLCSRMAEATAGHTDMQLVPQAIQTVVVLGKRDGGFRLTEIASLTSIIGNEVTLGKVISS